MDKYEAKSLIIDAFKHNVLGTKPRSELNLNHDGAEGHWLEVRLGKVQMHQMKLILGLRM